MKYELEYEIDLEKLEFIYLSNCLGYELMEHDEDELLEELELEWLSNKNIYSYHNFLVEEELEDIIEYSFELKYGKEYNSLNYYLEEGAKEFIKIIEQAYWQNTLDTFTLYHDPKFIEWLTNKYEEDAYETYLKSLNLRYLNN